MTPDYQPLPLKIVKRVKVRYVYIGKLPPVKYDGDELEPARDGIKEVAALKTKGA